MPNKRHTFLFHRLFHISVEKSTSMTDYAADCFPPALKHLS